MLITVTEGLNELNLLDTRITNALTQAQFVAMQVGNKDIGGHIKPELFTERAKASLQSVQALIKRRNEIKSAIVASNAVVKVKVASKEYVVAEAIERKNSIGYDKRLLTNLNAQYQGATRALIQEDASFTANLNRQIELAVGKDTKGKEDDVAVVVKSFTALNKPALVDPLKSFDLIASMQKEIEEFESQVDIALSIINATTFIEISG